MLQKLLSEAIFKTVQKHAKAHEMAQTIVVTEESYKCYNAHASGRCPTDREDSVLAIPRPKSHK